MKVILLLSFVTTLMACGSSPESQYNEDMEEMHEDNAEAAEEAGLDDLQQIHQDSADHYDNLE